MYAMDAELLRLTVRCSARLVQNKDGTYRGEIIIMKDNPAGEDHAKYIGTARVRRLKLNAWNADRII